MPELGVEGVQLFIAFVVPGLISMTVYRLVMPARAMDWSHAVLQGLFYSAVNFAALLPLFLFLARPETHWVVLWAGSLLVLLVFPAIWPLLIRLLFAWKWTTTIIQVPYPTAWDFFFHPRHPVLLLIHLKNGTVLGGYWGAGSFAGTFPNDGDLYVEALYSVDSGGLVREPIPGTKGALLRKEQYDYLEFFEIPKEEADA